MAVVVAVESVRVSVYVLDDVLECFGVPVIVTENVSDDAVRVSVEMVVVLVRALLVRVIPVIEEVRVNVELIDDVVVKVPVVEVPVEVFVLLVELLVDVELASVDVDVDDDVAVRDCVKLVVVLVKEIVLL